MEQVLFTPSFKMAEIDFAYPPQDRLPVTLDDLELSDEARQSFDVSMGGQDAAGHGFAGADGSLMYLSSYMPPAPGWNRTSHVSASSSTATTPRLDPTELHLPSIAYAAPPKEAPSAAGADDEPDPLTRAERQGARQENARPKEQRFVLLDRRGHGEEDRGPTHYLTYPLERLAAFEIVRDQAAGLLEVRITYRADGGSGGAGEVGGIKG